MILRLFSLAAATAVLGIAVTLFVRADDSAAAGDAADESADNGLCYVCHLDLQKEAITTSHLGEDIGCTDCHGRSAEHMHDEMLMTKPDQLFGRREVNDMCGTCHDDAHEDVEAEVAAFLNEWRGRDRPNGRVITEQSICTDCHGTHNIVKKMGTADGQEEAEWTALFGGENLDGWKASGAAVWKTKYGRLVGTLGEGATGGELLTEAQYKDFLLAVTFRATFPVKAGIWLRVAEQDRGPRIEIVRSRNPLALTGSLYVPERGLALVNLRKDLFDAGGWNTLSVKSQGPRVQIWLNGEEIGSAVVPGPEQGRLGLYLTGGQPFADGELAVREVQIQELPEEEQP